MTTVAIMQPYFFPYLGYFQLIGAVDTFVLYDRFNYIKEGWINRNRLLASSGEPFYFAVPIREKSSHRKIGQVRIATTRWKKKLLRSLQVHYGRAPFFKEVFPLVERIIAVETESLSLLNNESLVRCCDFLGISTRVACWGRTQSCEPMDRLEQQLARTDTALQTIFPHIQLEQYSRHVIRVIEICRILEATVYLNPIGGRSLYSKQEFDRNGLELRFLRTRPTAYPQNSTAHGGVHCFQPNLSIIDVLMNCGRDRTRQLLDEYDLV